jgi:hypothetical protein
LLAESIDAENPERTALDIFDRLRLREPFAKAFGALGFEGEEGWRVAARIKVVLLGEAGVGKEEVPTSKVTPTEAASEDAAAVSTFDSESPAVTAEPAVTEVLEEKSAEAESIALSNTLWADPDVRWLTGVHEAKGRSYLVREQYEELLWWLLMPSLLKMAGSPALDRLAIKEIGKKVDQALASAETAGYRVDVLLGLPDQEEEAAETVDTASPHAKERQSKEESEELEIVAADIPLADSADPIDSVDYAEHALRKPSK